MGRKKRVRRGAAVWRQLFSRQSSCGLSVPEFCRREGINASPRICFPVNDVKVRSRAVYQRGFVNTDRHDG